MKLVICHYATLRVFKSIWPNRQDSILLYSNCYHQDLLSLIPNISVYNNSTQLLSKIREYKNVVEIEVHVSFNSYELWHLISKEIKDIPLSLDIHDWLDMLRFQVNGNHKK